jgi:hemerythrin superfamily protein
MAGKTKSKQTARDESSADAIAMLMADHKKVKKLFSEFRQSKEENGDDDKAGLVEQICTELTIHAAIEEEIFYPAVRKSIDDPDLMDEALVEHAGAKSLIAQLQEMEVGDDLYEAKVSVLGEQIEHHVKEEEGEMFKQAKKAKVDTAALCKKMMDRKGELMDEMGLTSSEDGEEEDGEAGKVKATQKKAASAAKGR